MIINTIKRRRPNIQRHFPPPLADVPPASKLKSLMVETNNAGELTLHLVTNAEISAFLVLIKKPLPTID